MNPDSLEAFPLATLAAQDFGRKLADAIAYQVERAVVLERDRHDAELAELREDVAGLALALSTHMTTGDHSRLHSVKVEP